MTLLAVKTRSLFVFIYDFFSIEGRCRDAESDE
jgi:hypothetical protein